LKTGLYSVLYAVISSLAIAICFVPFVFLGFRKVRRVNTYCIIGIYWLFNGLVNLPALKLIHSAAIRDFFQRFSDFYDLADTPLVLLVFAVASPGRLRKQLLAVLLCFIAGEWALIARKGYSPAWPIIIGAGVLLILIYSITGLWQYLKKMEHNPFENSMAYVYAALLFAYFTYLIIYFLSYYKKSMCDEADSFLIYYISLLLSAAVTSAGIWSYGLKKRGALASGYSSSSS